ncbi:MAG: hypothetical protein CVT72_04490 [Alphaproteobacteria bacterium HGW-Alphaproteobacteria-11]|nr:MAG: hypothetical protein CVT72_04490 [Alphaproteobacteria bacterium HGW-Alphaproteobacteria-11]
MQKEQGRTRAAPRPAGNDFECHGFRPCSGRRRRGPPAASFGRSADSSGQSAVLRGANSAPAAT